MIFDRTLGIAILSAILYWAAFPPLDLPWLVWLVPALWTVLIKQPATSRADANTCGEVDRAARVARHWEARWRASLFYLKIWFAGTLFWLLTVHWMCLLEPLWAKVLWFSFGSGLAITWVVFIGLSRTAVQRLKMPVIVAAPLIWCGIEWMRKNWFFGGFSYGSLEHTQYRNPLTIQTADIAGEYLVGMLIVFVGACIGHLLTWRAPNEDVESRGVVFLNSRAFTLAAGVGVPTLAILYGAFRMSGSEDGTRPDASSLVVKVALLQGNIDNSIDSPAQLSGRRFEQYRRLTQSIPPGMDLVVWPENTCPLLLSEFESDFVPEGWSGQDPKRVREVLSRAIHESRRPLVRLAEAAGARLLIGLDSTVYQRESTVTRQNSAVAIDPKFGIGTRYDKVKLAPFLEYVPLARWNPFRDAEFVPYTPGESFQALPLPRDSRISHESSTGSTANGSSVESEPLWAAVNICHESSFPHYIRNQVRMLSAQGKKPDVLINLSNDGSWRYPAMAEMHLATHVFRAIENRTQYLSATNAGYSVWIDPDGRIVKQGKRGEDMFVVADVYRTPMTAPYHYFGDALPVFCVLFNAYVLGRWAFLLLRGRTRSP